jgi:hypothetical protein
MPYLNSFYQTAEVFFRNEGNIFRLAVTLDDNIFIVCYAIEQYSQISLCLGITNFTIGHKVVAEFIYTNYNGKNVFWSYSMLTPSTNNILLENTTEGKSLIDVSKLIEGEVSNDSLSDTHPMLKFAGIFKDDADFAAVVAHIAKERESIEVEE